MTQVKFNSLFGQKGKRLKERTCERWRVTQYITKPKGVALILLSATFPVLPHTNSGGPLHNSTGE